MSALLLAVGLNVKNQQEDPWNQNEQEAGDESEIVGFHGRWDEPRERITDTCRSVLRVQASSSAVAASSALSS